jgi:hypothetical protein
VRAAASLDGTRFTRFATRGTDTATRLAGGIGSTRSLTDARRHT